jgi:hypothetical protein
LVAASGGNARRDGGVGPALPPGNYDVLVQDRLGKNGAPPFYTYPTPPVPIRATTYHHPQG